MKKAVNVLSVLVIVLVLAQIVCMFLPYWTLTPIADRLLNPNPQPTDFSIQDYCWTECRTMNKIFDKMFKENYNGAKYVTNDYVLGLVLTFLFGVLAIALSVIKTVKSILKTKAPLVNVLCHGLSLAWAGVALYNFFFNFILTLTAYPMVHTLLIAFAIPAAVVVVVRLVLDIIIGVKAYRAEYCV